MLIGRLRRALAPEYAVEREVAGGGMGVVFAARQIRLDRIVAIKILRPEYATAVGAERFLAEGRLLARLSHPNIVPIHDAGEADGLLYIVMEFVEGETLAERLQRGRLSGDEAIRLAQDFLAALAAAHAQGVVHRDVKPANIFLRKGQALLGDFGIARWQEATETGLTTPGQLIGTPRYMSPEQRDGLAGTVRTDVYAAGLVLWEACTGERWPAYQAVEKADWRRVPSALVPALKRAIALDPAERWADAGEFLMAVGPPRRGRRVRWIAAALGMVGLLAYGAWRIGGTHPAPTTATLVEVTPFEVSGFSSGATLGDSIALELTRTLGGNTDFQVRFVRGTDRNPQALRLVGTARFTDGRVVLGLTGQGPRGKRIGPLADSSSRQPWPALVASLADTVLRRIWESEDTWLPTHALPKSAEGLNRWHGAEGLYAQGQWENARDAYTAAENVDPTCLLCSYRLLDIGRWLGGAADSARVERVHRDIDSFPPHYRALIVAQRLPWPVRYDSLSAAATAYPDFFLASFLLGDEIFHRGALYGHRRQEAREPLQRAIALRPDFAPGWEHLAWLLLSEGGKAESRRALDSVPPERARAGLSMVLRLMLNLGFEWRFGTPEGAETLTRRVLAEPGVGADIRTPSGGRLMMTVDAPLGAIGLGAMLEGWRTRPDAVRSGLLAQAHGYAALGRPDSLRAIGTRLSQLGSERDLPLYALALEGALVLFDPDSSVQADSGLLARLQRFADSGKEARSLRHRAAWMLGLLAARAGDGAAVAGSRARLSDEVAPGTLGVQLDTWSALRHGDTAMAGKLLDGMRVLDLSHLSEEPLQDAVLRLMKAEVLMARGEAREAATSLRWHEHLQLVDFPTGDPQAGEAAWALSTLIRWRRTLVLEQIGQPDPELCDGFNAVARLWKDGLPRYAARADTARRKAAAQCGASR